MRPRDTHPDADDRTNAAGVYAIVTNASGSAQQLFGKTNWLADKGRRVAYRQIGRDIGAALLRAALTGTVVAGTLGRSGAMTMPAHPAAIAQPAWLDVGLVPAGVSQQKLGEDRRRVQQFFEKDFARVFYQIADNWERSTAREGVMISDVAQRASRLDSTLGEPLSAMLETMKRGEVDLKQVAELNDILLSHGLHFRVGLDAPLEQRPNAPALRTTLALAGFLGRVERIEIFGAEMAAPQPRPSVGRDCAGGLCRCLSFVFPDTDSAVGSPGDGHTLVGPVKIKVQTAGELTAVIDQLFVRGSQSLDPFSPSFVALPPPTAFTGLEGEPGGEVVAAPHDQGNLFIPFDFAVLLSPDVKRTRFLEANVPGLATGDPIVIDVFTREGRRLPPLARQVAPNDILGTADAADSVLRVAGGALRAGSAPEEGKGPIVIPNVVGFADPRRSADPITLTVGDKFAVFENRECGLLDAATECTDLNNDGDQTDSFLLALDVTRPRAEPMVVDQVNAQDFPGYPATFPAFTLYTLAASDQAVAFHIPEPASIDPNIVVDINGSGQVGDLIPARFGTSPSRWPLRSSPFSSSSTVASP